MYVCMHISCSSMESSTPSALNDEVGEGVDDTVNCVWDREIYAVSSGTTVTADG